MQDRIALLILKLVAEHNGQWYWYQIDRALSTSYGLNGPYQKEITALQEQGLLDMQPTDRASHVRYCITDAGRAVLEQEQLL